MIILLANTLGHNSAVKSIIETIILQSSLSTRRLSKRLSAIDKSIADRYHHIWDCCCDHGYLGRVLLARSAAPHIHFVDIVPSIMAHLDQRLADCEVTNSQYHTYCQDVEKLPLDNFSKDDKHLIIIAGVGGDFTLDIVNQLLLDHGDKQLEFILCPVRQQFLLRSQLAKRGLSLIDEQLVKDEKWFYEIIHLTTGTGEPIEGIGSKLWHQPNQWHVQHLEIVLAHFNRMANNPDNDVSGAIASYQRLLSILTSSQELI